MQPYTNPPIDWVAQTAALHQSLLSAMARSAAIAWAQAPKLCRYADGSACRDYHRVWQYLGLFGIAPSTRADTEFLLQHFRDQLRSVERPCVLICGSADYAMLAHVLHAAALAGAQVQITVLDRCETPLLLNRWYAEDQQAKVQTVCADALQYVQAARFDLITAHSFLGWFSPIEQRQLLQNWRDSLRPGGRIVTTRRLYQKSGDGPKRFDADEAASYAVRVREAAARFGADLPASAEEFGNVALGYARSHVRHATQTQQELVALFTVAGLEITCSEAGAELEGMGRPSGPRKGAGTRVRIVAQRGDAP